VILRSSPNLAVLSLAGTGIADTGAAAIAELLRTARADPRGRNPPGGAAWWAPPPLPSPGNNVPSGPLTNQLAIPAMAGVPVRSRRRGRVQRGGEGRGVPAACSPSLQEVDISRNGIGDEGAIALARALDANPPRLTLLNLAGNRVATTGGYALPPAHRGP